MRLDKGTVAGFLVGLNVFLAMALTGVIAANGINNPGVGRDEIFSAAGGATAPEPVFMDERKGSSVHDLDLDGDGRISLAEAAGHDHIVTRFERADRNRDGKLTQAEFDRLAKLPPPKARKPISRETLRRDAAAASAGG